MVKSLPTMVDTHIKEQVKKQVPKQVRDQVPVYVAKGLILERQNTKEEMQWMIAKAILQERDNIQAKISSQIQKAIDNQIPSQVDAPSVVRPRDQDDPHDDAHPKGENSAKPQKTFEYKAYVYGESSSGQVNEEERGPSTLGNQEQEDDYDFWTDSYASDDDEISSKQVSQDIREEVSLTIDEAYLKKMADEMLRQRCTSGDEHQYHIDQMKNFLQNDIVWESRKKIPVSLHPRKTTPFVQSCQGDLEAPALSLINQDLLYLKKRSSGPEKIVLWVNKCVNKFNPYARYGVEHWKNPHAKIFYIRKQKEPGKPKEEVDSNSKIIQVIKIYWESGHEHKFVTEIVTRRANECIVLITEPDYKNLNKNDIEDMYLLIMNGKVPDYAEIRQYQENYDISYYITPHNHSLTELIKDTHVPKVITPNEQNIPHTKDVKGLPNQINTEETQEQTVHNEQINYQPSEEPSRNNTGTSVPITELSVPEVTQSQITHHASTSSHHALLDRWSRDQHIELMNIIGEPIEGMITRSMAAKLTVASASECLFADFLSESEPKQVFRDKKDELGTVTRNKAKFVTQVYSQEQEIDYDETFVLAQEWKSSGSSLPLPPT
ncbi:hypothetical protein Tco_1500085 [Tanacetum coccineum]